MKTNLLFTLVIAALAFFSACEEEEMDNGMMPLDPDTAEKASIDRFSEAAGMLMVRNSENNLPAANEPINFDSGEPFITQGLGPGGEMVEYYNFDVQPTTPAPIYVLFREGADSPVADQLNIINVIPGDAGYNDFWQVYKVTVPEDYVANTATSMQDLQDEGYPMEAMDAIVNCPVVPDGSTASKRLGGGDASLTEGWYKNMLVYYFNFSEKELSVDNGAVPLSPIYVSFNVNPGEDGGGPASGFVTEGNSAQTHNVVATLPEDDGYSPLWTVNAFDNAEFGLVTDLSSASAATSTGSGLANVNCPVVSIDDSEPEAKDPETADEASIDRFSEDAGTLMVRTESNNLPEANAAIDFDAGEPFITKGLGPNGENIEYYNFDVQPTAPAPIYVLFRQGEDMPVDGQLNIIDVIPGDAGYNDFWQVHKVTVPADYVANTVTSFEGLQNKKYPVQAMETIVNCPIVPDGSTATKRMGGEDASLTTGWYKDQVVYYFNFSEKALTTTNEGEVPLSPIYVCFNINPGEDGGGPASGFKTEDMSVQTHNVVATLPADASYSPLWNVNAFDNAEFGDVMNLTTASSATSVGMDLATVNCPVVSMEE